MSVYAWRPAKHDDQHARLMQIFGLSTWQLFPRGDQHDVPFLRRGPRAKPRITKETPILTAGSCFAESLAVVFRAQGYNVLAPDGKPEPGACGMFNTFTLRQELERAFGTFAPAVPHWTFRSQGQERYIDPYRYRMAWESADEIADELGRYTASWRDVLKRCKVFIFTAGQTEYWRNRNDKAAYAYTPTPAAYDPTRDEACNSTLAENQQNLQRAFDLHRLHNSKVQWIVTVSPVFLQATFTQQNAVVAAHEAKATLRAAVGAFVNANPAAHYFPSYEAVVNPRSGGYCPDNCHVTDTIIRRVLDLFRDYFGGVSA